MSQFFTLLHEQARSHGERIAFHGFRHGKDQLCDVSYQALLAEVEQTAAVLNGFEPRCIALKAANSIDWAIVDLAALILGIPIVPVPSFFTPSQVQHTLTSCGADLLIGDWQESDGKDCSMVAGLSVFRPYDAALIPLLPGSRKVTFTSGSTGQPKGVCLSEGNLFQVSNMLAQQVSSSVLGGRHLALLPLATLLENITAIYVPLILGQTSVLLNGEQTGLSGSSQFNPQHFLAALIHHRPSSLVLTPALLMALIQLVQIQPDIAKSFRFIAVGGARVSAALIARAHELGLPVYEGYGLSECGSVVALNLPDANQLGSAGKVLGHNELKIDEQGQVWIKGNTALGYIDEPFTTPWLATGDIGELDEKGYLTITGRVKNQIITAFGRNVSPEWVETEAQRYMSLQRMVVIGDGELNLTAVVCANDDEMVVDDVRGLNSQLPDYARIGRVLCVANSTKLREFYTSNGKPIRSSFEAWAANLTEHEQVHSYHLTQA
ncbi:AMP-binding protein [Vibrio porteresiae]|uniref:AMP-binding protein n=1 Tax=Vibrio porteresiae DSM 19223 TaxID=1123496 RepID=A0ABZ0QI43_9VIBR|nr:AMP-binding protein [Vibrio porteresiae]WPC76166.1 AMP-binding protein [Vibrio porteresiae DSM 19223]